MGREKPGKPRRARFAGGQEIEGGSGIYYNPAQGKRELRDPGAGIHLWTAVTAFVLSDDEARRGFVPGEQVHLDMENISEFGIGCFKCEEPYSEALAGRRCPGSMDVQ